MGDNKSFDKGNIATGGGNYSERIEGNYIQGNKGDAINQSGSFGVGDNKGNITVDTFNATNENMGGDHNEFKTTINITHNDISAPYMLSRLMKEVRVKGKGEEERSAREGKELIATVSKKSFREISSGVKKIGANLSGAKKISVIFSGAILMGVIFSGAILLSAILIDANLISEDLIAEDLMGAIFSGAIFSGAILSGAKKIGVGRGNN